jgi:hypothetical protein
MLGVGNLAGAKLGNDRQNIFLRDFEHYSISEQQRQTTMILDEKTAGLFYFF